MPSERSPFRSPVEPISPPPKSACLKRAWVEAPGTAPGSERLITMPIYHHSRPRGQQIEYRGRDARREGAPRRTRGRAPSFRGTTWPRLRLEFLQRRYVIIQTESKSSQAEPSQPQLQPNFSKEKALISLDSLVRNEPFQRVALTPWA
jgi:hypothetical protein